MAATALVVEDHPLYRDALALLLKGIFGADGVRVASSAEEGLRLAEASAELNLILLDPGLPGINGVEAVAAFRRRWPEIPVIAISASEDRRDATAALRAGAVAFVSKAASTEVVSDLVRRVRARELPEPAWITATGPGSLDESAQEMTPRQREILVLLCQGHPNKEIGLRLGLAEVTVKMHVSALFRFLGVANRTQALLAARRLGLYSGG